MWMMAAILLLPSCANSSDKDNEELDTNERVSDSHQNEKSEDDYAKELIKAAFEYEVPSENEPIIDVVHSAALGGHWCGHQRPPCGAAATRN